MGVYSSLEVYPSDYDVDLSECNVCGFLCDVYGYCKQEYIWDFDLQDKYLYDVLEQKGYGGCNLKAESILGKTYLVLYPLQGAEIIAEKCNVELGCPVPLVNTNYTMGVPGLNLSNCYSMFLEVVDKLSNINDPVSYKRIVSVEDMYEYLIQLYPDSFKHCEDIGVTVKAEVVNLISALNRVDLHIVSCDGNVTGYIPREELIL